MVRFGTFRKLRWLIGAVFLGFGICANATLIDRGNGLIYDDVLDITWLQDAGLGGHRIWDNAVVWADGLMFGGFDDWRLPSVSVAGGLPTGSAFPVVDCSTASEMDCRDNEFGYMYYQNLGGTRGDDLTGNQGLIQNIADVISVYWSGTEYPLQPDTSWDFFFSRGRANDLPKGISVSTWAVRPGDVLAVPEPATLLLLGVGLAG